MKKLNDGFIYGMIGSTISLTFLMVFTFGYYLFNRPDILPTVEPETVVSVEQTEDFYDKELEELIIMLDDIEKRTAALEDDMELLQEEISTSAYRISFTDEEFYELAMLIEHEAGAESYDCMLWTACVVVNRVLDEQYPNTLYEVIYDNKHAVQFSPTIDGLYKKPSQNVLNACTAALKKDYTSGSLIFNNSTLTSNDKQAWFEKFTLVAEIDDVQFRR